MYSVGLLVLVNSDSGRKAEQSVRHVYTNRSQIVHFNNLYHAHQVVYIINFAIHFVSHMEDCFLHFCVILHVIVILTNCHIPSFLGYK